MHALAQLRELEEKYRDELVVIGVHSAKFMAEKSTEAIREAVLRYEIKHPVVNDRDFKMWDAYAVRAWPTMMFIDPTGKVIGKHEGEVPVETFDQLLSQMMAEFDRQGLIDRRPVSWRLEQLQTASPLAFPGKVLADEASGRLFIADTNHHRIIVAGLDGAVRQVIGQGEMGFEDGPCEKAKFNGPQGLALAGETLYVADTANHAIRAVDLAEGAVTTLAGTGQQARKYYRHGGPGREILLNSPWDLVYVDGVLYIAMAGFHQCWRLDLAQGLVQPWAGSGREGISDGKLREAMFAQPNGIAYHQGFFYVADSETSAIRQINAEAGTVSSPVGLGLYEFGDVDGVGEEVRLQHPQGVAIGPDGTVYIADCYNSKIKKLNPVTQEVVSWLGDGTGGYSDGVGKAARFNEPGGLSLTGNKLYIADTNNHFIRVADLASGEVTTLALKGL